MSLSAKFSPIGHVWIFKIWINFSFHIHQRYHSFKYSWRYNKHTRIWCARSECVQLWFVSKPTEDRKYKYFFKIYFKLNIFFNNPSYFSTISRISSLTTKKNYYHQYLKWIGIYFIRDQFKTNNNPIAIDTKGCLASVPVLFFRGRYVNLTT